MDSSPSPAPMTAEAMLLDLIQSNKAERDLIQSDIDNLTQEANRLDTIREGLEGALRAARSAALRSVVDSREGRSTVRHTNYGQDAPRG